MSILDQRMQIAIFVCIGSMMVSPASAQSANPVPPAQLQSFANDPNIRPPNKELAAPLFTPWGKISFFQGGWYNDRVTLRQDVPPGVSLTNPDHCPLETEGYILNENHVGRNLFSTILLSAFLNGREVAMVISGCYFDRPQVVSVAIH